MNAEINTVNEIKVGGSFNKANRFTNSFAINDLVLFKRCGQQQNLVIDYLESLLELDKMARNLVHKYLGKRPI